jgi:hypothetical protein
MIRCLCGDPDCAAEESFEDYIADIVADEDDPHHTPEELAELNKDFLPSRAGRKGDSQDLPVINDFEDVQSAVIADINARRLVGIDRYGTALQPFNKRNALLDLYEELLDAAMYVKQRLIEDELSADIPCPNCAVESGNTVFGAVVDGL